MNNDIKLNYVTKINNQYDLGADKKQLIIISLLDDRSFNTIVSDMISNKRLPAVL